MSGFWFQPIVLVSTPSYKRQILCPLADSLNLSVATALMTQRLLDIDESAIGDMSPEEKHTLRAKW